MWDIRGVFAYSDRVGTLTSPSPIPVSGGEYETPCTRTGGCCISGTTVLWTEMNGMTPTYVEWGAGLGFSLSDPGAGNQISAYTGKAKGFTFTVKGTTVWQDISVWVKHDVANSEAPPIVNVTAPGTWSIKFTDAKCSNYPYTESKCVDSTGGVYQVMVVVNGGTQAGAFNLCLTSLTPIL